MKEKPSAHKRKEKNAPVMQPDSLPDLITICPKCGSEIELWSEEDETTCSFCGHKLFEKETTTH